MSVTVDPLTLTKVEPPKPQPIPGQVYRHRETTDAEPHADPFGNTYVLARYDGDGVWSIKYSVRQTFERDAQAGVRTDWVAQVAAGRYVPYTPPVISNATHAGRRVRYTFNGKGRVASANAARVYLKGLNLKDDNRYVVVMWDDGNMDGYVSEVLTLLD